MNIKRPLFWLFASQILGIILASSVLLTTKVILVTIAFVFLCKIIFNKKINFIGIIIVSLMLVISLLRFNIEKNYYDTINIKIENAANYVIGEIIEKGKTANSTYANLKTNNYGIIKIYNVDLERIKIGNTIKAYGHISKNSSSTNRGEFNFEIYYRSIGITSNMYTTTFEIIDYGYNPLLNGIYDIKENIQERINLIFDENDSGIIQAILAGNKSEMNNEIKELYQDNGISHILAISGLHLSILGLMLFNTLRKKFTIEFSAAITSAFIFVYGIFINASASSIRAISMLFVRFLSLTFKRAYDSKNTLAIIGIILLFKNPYLVFNSGFQFSFSAIYFLNLYDRKIGYNGIKIPANIILALGMLPITICNYFTYPTYSLILNLIVIPLMTFVLCFSILAILISYINIFPAVVVATCVHFILKFYEICCKIFSKIPYSHIVFGKSEDIYIILFYIFLFGLVYSLYYKKYFKSLLCSCILIIALYLLPYKTPYCFMTSFINIGQGDSICIQDEKTIITIDGGSTSNKNNGKYILEPFFLSQKITQINKAYITHADSDHTNGILYLIENSKYISIDEIILPCFAEVNTKYKNIIQAATNKNIKIKYIDNTYKVANIICLYPFRNMVEPKEVNDHSLVLKLNKNINNQKCSFLFTGDATQQVEKLLIDSNANLQSTVLKVGHHGSKTSTSEEFVLSVAPKISILSYGKNNYGHPNNKIIKNLEMLSNNAILHTFTSGEIDFCILCNKNIFDKLNNFLLKINNKNVKVNNIYIDTFLHEHK